jgi:hypothetical protein
VLDTAGADADRYQDLIAQAALSVPPPYRPVAGKPVYQIRVGDDVVMVAEQEVTGPLRELVMAVLAADGGEARAQA